MISIYQVLQCSEVPAGFIVVGIRSDMIGLFLVESTA